MVGYFKFQSENNSLSGRRHSDWRRDCTPSETNFQTHTQGKDKFPLVSQRNLLPEEPGNFKEILDAYHNELKLLGFKIMSALAQGMGRFTG